MTGRVHAMVPLLLALLVMALAMAVAGCATETAMEGAEDGISFERNSEFSGPRLRVFLTLRDGSEGSVNTTDDAIGTRPGETPLPGHEARDWTFLKDAEAGTTLAHALVSWDPGNPADYLMAGWWIQFPGQHPPELSLADSVQYVIVDGPEIDPANPPALPPAGEATYTGNAGGVYVYVPEGDQDAAVVDEYLGTITLSANFADRTLSGCIGCIGCIGDLSTRRAHFGVVLGDEVLDAQSRIADYELNLRCRGDRSEGQLRDQRHHGDAPRADASIQRWPLGRHLLQYPERGRRAPSRYGVQLGGVRGERRERGSDRRGVRRPRGSVRSAVTRLG